jgi:hypothetical protein
VGAMYAADQRWRAGDPGRAIALADEARAALRRDGDAADELAELAAWRAHHR